MLSGMAIAIYKRTQKRTILTKYGGRWNILFHPDQYNIYLFNARRGWKLADEAFDGYHIKSIEKFDTDNKDSRAP